MKMTLQLPKIKPYQSNPNSLRRIAGILAECQGHTFEEISGPSRIASLVFARHSVMLVCRDEVGATHEAIGKLLNRHHSNVSHACTSLTGQSQIYPEIAKRLKDLGDIARKLLKN